ncbi:head-tail connector protein [Burkholderia contaminans]|uniref:head-tail connector protein n=2 Tax=Burkholderia TaxID=32008 RepID=UPI003464C226
MRLRGQPTNPPIQKNNRQRRKPLRPMSDLITLAQAKAQLRITDTDSDGELASLVSAASDIVVGYLKTVEAAAYTADTVPPRVRTAVLLVLASLYEDREGANDPIGPAVQSLLMRDRDPALA